MMNHAIWLSNFIRRTTNSYWGQSCPQLRSNVLTEVKCSKVFLRIQDLVWCTTKLLHFRLTSSCPCKGHSHALYLFIFFSFHFISFRVISFSFKTCGVTKLLFLSRQKEIRKEKTLKFSIFPLTILFSHVERWIRLCLHSGCNEHY